jgi:chemotaxis signal transduction protein|tara:strand:+ start:404 stop:730 length:327 start_codon:yes stop_codon:yes gene_type:complete
MWDQVGNDDDSVTFAHGFAYSVTLGRLFIDDHESRDLPYGIMVAENKRTYTLLMTVDDIREVYSDASHYVDSMGEWLEDDDTGYARSVIQAAGRVVEALRKQVPDVLV